MTTVDLFVVEYKATPGAPWEPVDDGFSILAFRDQHEAHEEMEDMAWAELEASYDEYLPPGVFRVVRYTPQNLVTNLAITIQDTI